MAKSHLKLVTPSTVKRTVTPKRRRNGDLRTREYELAAGPACMLAVSSLLTSDSTDYFEFPGGYARTLCTYS